MTSAIQKHLKFNIAVNILDAAFFGMGMGFASYVTILPLFVSTMTDSALLIGLIPAIHVACWQLPQVFIVRRLSRQTSYKPIMLSLTIQERLPLLGLMLVAWFLPHLPSPLALSLTFALITWQSLGSGFTATPCQSLIAKIIPSELRGTFLGAQGSAGDVLASFSAVLAGVFLQRLPTAQGFALCFLLAAIDMLLSYIFLALTREPAHSTLEQPPDTASFWSSVGAILQGDPNFRWLLVGRMLAQMSTLAFAFYSVYAVGYLGVSKEQVGFMTGMGLAVQIFANPLMGWLGDRWSQKRVMQLGLLASLVSALLAFWSHSGIWFYIVFLLAGVTNVSIWTVGLAMIMRFGKEGERPAYIGLANTLIAPVSILTPILGGSLADFAGYPAAFLASALFGFLGILVFHWRVKDLQHPGAQPNSLAALEAHSK